MCVSEDVLRLNVRARLLAAVEWMLRAPRFKTPWGGTAIAISDQRLRQAKEAFLAAGGRFRSISEIRRGEQVRRLSRGK